MRRAATAVETGIVIGVCILFMLAIYEYGRFIMFRQLLENAAREGARVAVVSPSSLDPATATAAVTDTVIHYLANQPLNNRSIQIYKADASGNNIGAWTDAPFGNNIAVEVSGDYQPMLPTFGLLPNSITITTKCVMRSEAN
jgi:Flp pilus assembly protein TadG